MEGRTQPLQRSAFAGVAGVQEERERTDSPVRRGKANGDPESPGFGSRLVACEE